MSLSGGKNVEVLSADHTHHPATSTTNSHSAPIRRNPPASQGTRARRCRAGPAEAAGGPDVGGAETASVASRRMARPLDVSLAFVPMEHPAFAEREEAREQ